MPRPDRRRRHILRHPGVAAGVVSLAMLAGVVFVAGAGATLTCTDTWSSTTTGGDWGSAGSWSTGNVPGSSDVACWSSNVTLTVSSADTAVADAVQGGSLDITGGSFALAGAGVTSSLVNLTTVGPGADALSINGPGTIAVSGALNLTGGADIGETSPVTINQTGGGVFQIGAPGSATTHFYAGMITSTSNISIDTLYFVSAGPINSPTLTTTGTATLDAGGYPAADGARLNLSANGFVITGLGTTPQGYNLIQTGGTTVVPSGDYFTPGTGYSLQGGTLQLDGTIETRVTITGGTLSGTGVVSDGGVGNTSGTVEPGDGGNPGTLTVAGEYTQGAGGTLEIPVTGTASGDYSVLSAGGATLAGALELAPSGAGATGAAIGETLPVLPGTGQTGTFSTVTAAPSLGGSELFIASYTGTGTDAVVAGLESAPQVSGGTVEGDTLTSTSGTWTGNPTFGYQWERCTTEPAFLRVHVESTCAPITGATSSSYQLTAADVGTWLFVDVTATYPASGSLSAVGSPVKGPVTAVTSTPPNTAPGPVSGPTVTGTPLPGDTLTCNPGTWTGTPTFSYQWVLGTNPITGATAKTYTVTILDEGQTITCDVSASNAAGTSSGESPGVIVAQKGTLTCPKPTGAFSAKRIGSLSLGEARAAARKALSRYHVTHYGFDDFCLYGGWGIRGAYKRNRFVLLLTANPYYRFGSVSVGLTIASVAARLHVGKVFPIGLNDWYVASGTSSNYVFKVRHGVIQEIGIANKADTSGTRAAQRAFLASFTGV